MAEALVSHAVCKPFGGRCILLTSTGPFGGHLPLRLPQKGAQPSASAADSPCVRHKQVNAGVRPLERCGRLRIFYVVNANYPPPPNGCLSIACAGPTFKNARRFDEDSNARTFDNRGLGTQLPLQRCHLIPCYDLDVVYLSKGCHEWFSPFFP